jgi:hypothetical protein
VSEPGEFTMDSAVTPGGVLACHLERHRADLLGDRWAAGTAVGIGPATSDQLGVPAQQRAGRDDPVEPERTGEKSAQSGQQGAVGPGQSRAGDLSAQDSQFMAQYEDLDVLGGI